VKDGEVIDTILVKDFKKVFKTKSKHTCKPDESLVAVSDLSFGLKQGECFALLGVNGAGKTTTFKSLTGEVLPTKGTITVGGFDIRKDFEKARKLIGYCPQSDLIYDDMTVEEHLKFYV
jgi:ATP-binding cassette subfamily A (ABC1) protein 3